MPTFNRYLPCKLDEDTAHLRSQEYAAADRRLAELRDELAKLVKTKRKEIKEQEARVNKVRDVVHAGREDMPVECEWRMDFQRKSAHLVRLDTGEDVEHRAMTADELQVPLAFPPGAQGRVAEDAAALGTSPVEIARDAIAAELVPACSACAHVHAQGVKCREKLEGRKRCDCTVGVSPTAAATIAPNPTDGEPEPGAGEEDEPQRPVFPPHVFVDDGNGRCSQRIEIAEGVFEACNLSAIVTCHQAHPGADAPENPNERMARRARSKPTKTRREKK